MIKERKIEDIVLYHGSLEELNSREPDKKYKFGKDTSFISGMHDEDGWFHAVREELAILGYSGIVNRRTIVVPREIEGDYYLVEGTPIVSICI